MMQVLILTNTKNDANTEASVPKMMQVLRLKSTLKMMQVNLPIKKIIFCVIDFSQITNLFNLFAIVS